MDIAPYLDRVRSRFATGDATEHSYRAALEALFEGVGEGLTAINEPRRVACGAPDFVIRRGGIAAGQLPPIHRDPFDRMLIAQAQVEGLTLLTADATIARYSGMIEHV